MAIRYSLKIPAENLSLYLDATNTKSATGGAYWYDMSAYKRTVNVYGSPSVTTLGGVRCYQLATTGDRFVANFPSNQDTNNLTFESWIYPAATEITSGDRGCIIQGYAYMSWNKSNQNLSSYWYSTSNQGYHEPGVSMAREQWHHVLTVWDASASSLFQYVNGSLVRTVSTVASGGYYYNTINIGWEGDSRQFAGGFGMIKIYNRALTSAEALACYNQTKARFGR